MASDDPPTEPGQSDRSRSENDAPRRWVLVTLAVLLLIPGGLLLHPRTRTELRDLVYGPPRYAQYQREMELLGRLADAIERFRTEDWDEDGEADWPESLTELEQSNPVWANGYWDEWPGVTLRICEEALCEANSMQERLLCGACDHWSPFRNPEAPCGPCQAAGCCDLPTAGESDPQRANRSTADSGRRIGASFDLLYSLEGTHWAVHLQFQVARKHRAREGTWLPSPSFYIDDSRVLRFDLEPPAGPESPPVRNVDQP